MSNPTGVLDWCWRRWRGAGRVRGDLVERERKAAWKRIVNAVAVTAGFWLGRMTVSVWLFNLGSMKKPSGAIPVFLTWTSKAVDVKAGTLADAESGKSLLTLTWLRRPTPRTDPRVRLRPPGWTSPGPLPTGRG